LNGSVYNSLGSLYAKVPGWPLGFGDKKKAQAYFEKALAINRTGSTPITSMPTCSPTRVNTPRQPTI